jgi:ubiquitin-conjugating enzyme E2 J2
MAGPSIIMYTPSGRFKPGERICTTMSDFHPHAWSTLWNVGTILEGLLSFMCEESGGAVGSISASEEERKRLAASSMAWNERHPRFRDEFPEEIRAYREMLARQAEEAAAAAAAAVSAMNSHSNLHGGNASRGDPSLQASRGNAAHGSQSTMREKENHNSFVHFVLFCFICFFIIWMT